VGKNVRKGAYIIISEVHESDLSWAPDREEQGLVALRTRRGEKVVKKTRRSRD